MFGVSAAIRRAISIPLPKTTVYTNGSGTHTFLSTTRSAQVWVTGGGAGGSRNDDNYYNGAMGGAGATAIHSFSVAGGSTATFVAGTRGNAAGSSGTVGTNGQTSSFVYNDISISAVGGYAAAAFNSARTGVALASGGAVNSGGGIGARKETSRAFNMCRVPVGSFWGGANHGCGGGSGAVNYIAGNGAPGIVVILEWSV